MTGPVSNNETERLRVLHSYEILDTPPEVAFDRLTTHAAQVFGVPIALVSLVDTDRQWFKACFGTDLRETSRDLSFCSYTILSDQALSIPDATKDPRFQANALVTGPPYIRFYAGAPLVTPSGQNIGSLCLIDTVPRQFSPAQTEMLINLAAMVVDEMELRRTARELREQEQSLRQALQENNELAVAITNLQSGVIITDPRQADNPIVYVNPGFCAMTGYVPDEILGRNCRFIQGPLTDPATRNDIRQAIREEKPWHGIMIDYHKNGTPFVNEVTITPIFDETGRIVSWVGQQTDVTEREQSRQLLEERVQERTVDLANSQIEILNRLARAAEYRDDDTGRHTQRVAYTSALLAEALGLSPETVSLMAQAAPLHDVGKIAISDLILLKPGKLTADEFNLMKTHTSIGAALLADGHSEVVQMAERIAHSHHERWDGSGYPRQLDGDQIPLEARILAIADVFDALTHERPYKAAWPIKEAVAEIERQSGRQFDPILVNAFLQLEHDTLI